MNRKQWKRLAREKTSPGKLAVGLGQLGFEHKIIEIHAGKKMYAKTLMKEGAAALRVGEGWPEESPEKEELALLQMRKQRQLPGVKMAARPGDPG